MTRETKIGLLVGLAFIIVVGILLSEHLTSTTERPAAPLADAGKTVRDGVSAPGTLSTPQPPVRVIEPAAPIPTAPEVTPGRAQVAIGSQSQQPPIVIDSRSPDTAFPAHTPIVQGQATQSGTVGTEAPIITRMPEPGSTDPFANLDPIQQAAKNAGEPLVPAGPTNTTTRETTLAANNAREYTAQPGDTLSRIAAMLPGGNTKANRDAIVKLNPILQKDVNKVLAGRVYMLPTEQAIKDTPKEPVKEPIVQQPALVEATKPADKPATGYRTYVVKKGDNLTRIASVELGSAKEVGTIRELNKDVLKGSDVVKVDMKLKLPLKSVASGN